MVGAALKGIWIGTLILAGWLVIGYVFVRCNDAYKNDQPLSQVVKVDTIYLHDTVSSPYAITIPYDCDSIRDLLDTERAMNEANNTKLFLARFKLEKIQYYLNIVIRNPSQIKYLKGWLIRALK